VGGDEEAEGGKRRALSLAERARKRFFLSFAPLSLAFFRGKIDQRSRKTD